MINVAVIYYSATGNVHALAEAAADGAQKAAADVRLRKVAELAPPEAIGANPQWAEHAAATAGIPEATLDDLEWADVVLFGTPTRYGNVASQLKQFIDTTGPLWEQGRLADKVYGAFTSASTRHGGHESTLVTLFNVFHHWGGIVVAPGYTDAIQFEAGTPYGTTYFSGNGGLPDDVAREAARYQAYRATMMAAMIKAGRDHFDRGAA